ncbi:uncharacterized protein Z518_09088 [Rhinocladiella mackenziei CBS 650.93]|uniref:NWD NACHT-NTPase N-terminal domain-containing protein n=1 Tax=Rhinocladiella mackenziei CBS 650.93 TaxID=1442369 RepID=A0A0D2GSK8_9EURO|nr:uncharacterized protein Z518_09088 [Rhinocladiella mackenziei CBS 650.93]KIX01363.1 hypothetical protein Z518_09088 [Rhinocladiella mackenziei CBS 650.93]
MKLTGLLKRRRGKTRKENSPTVSAAISPSLQNDPSRQAQQSVGAVASSQSGRTPKADPPAPIPSTSTAAPSSSPSAPPWSPQALWNNTYEKLKQKEPDLVQSFEIVSGASFISQEQIKSLVKARLDMRDERQWIITLAAQPVKIRESGERLIKFVLWSKDLVSSALSSQPHMVLAWSGITMQLPLALNPSQESDAMIQGLDHIAALLRLYDIRTTLCHGNTSDGYRSAIVELYSHVLEYQARMACHLSDNSVIRGIHSISRSGQWKTMVQTIDEADQYCQEHEALIDKQAEQEQWERQTKQIEQANETQEQILDALRHVLTTRAADREDDLRTEILQCLAADYSGQKNFNPKRVPNTCRWFLDDDRFHKWRDSTTSGVLWLSTGPGCGKSVLSRTLIDERLLSSRMMTANVCYFFFKDGLERRQRGEDALSAILHQIYSRNLASNLISHAYQPFKTNGQSLRSMFYPLWELLMTTSRHQAAGEIICLLDALDECQPDAREQLLDQLAEFYSNANVVGPAGPRIKFLITSRPNDDIDSKFRRLDATVNFIEFAEVVPRLDKASHSLIAGYLKPMEHRTYLWLYLVLQEIQRKFPSHATVRKIETLIGQLPTSVTKAYETILNQSSDQQVARTILKIIIAAKRDLTVEEMTVAIAITRTKEPRSYQELDLEPEKVRESSLRNICGFFISINKSKVSLIHQTAREFLLRSTGDKDKDGAALGSSMRWYHSLDIVDAEHTVAQVCITLLLFHFFKGNAPWADFYGTRFDWERGYGRLISKYPFLQYASTRWAEHYQMSQHLSKDEEIGLVLSICDVQRTYCQTWFPIYWYSEMWHERPPATCLVIASTFGLVRVVEQVLESLSSGHSNQLTACRESNLYTGINEPVEYFGNALQAASSRGHPEVVKMLLDRGADVNAEGGGFDNALQVASVEGHSEVVEMLLDRGADMNAQGGHYGNALQAASFDGHSEVVQMLLDRGADVNIQGGKYGTALLAASRYGHEKIEHILLRKM